MTPDEIMLTLSRNTNSTSRLWEMLVATWHEPPEVFWPVFQDMWSGCDDTWHYRDLVLAAFEKNGPAHPHLTGKDLQRWRSLPDEVTIYRGCERTVVGDEAQACRVLRARTSRHRQR